MKQSILKSLLVILGLTVTAFAQPTLPEQTVRPETEPTLPTQPVFDAPSDTSSAPDLSSNFPSLTDLQLGGNSPFGVSTGVLRSQVSLFDTPAAVDIVTRQQIQEKQSGTMFQALQNEVGVLMQSTAAGQASPFVRGLTGQQVLLLVDGIRMNNSVYRLGPNQYFNTIDPGMVDHIEVLRGQGSVLWGSDAIGGAINVVTRSADPFQRCCGGYNGMEFHEFFNTSDSSSYSRMNLEGWVGSTGYFGGGSYNNVRDLDTGWDFGRQPGTHYQSYAGDIKLNYLIDNQQMLTFAFQHYEQSDLARSDRFPGYPGDINNSNTLNDASFFDPQQRDLAYLRYTALDPIWWMDAFTFTGSFHRQRDDQTRPFRMSGGVPAPRLQGTDVNTVGLSAVAVKDMGTLGKITAGADWYHDDIDSTAVNGDVIYPDDAFYERLGIFLSWDVELTERLSTVAGVRYVNIDAGATPDVAGDLIHISPSYQDWVGSFGAVYELTDSVNLVCSISEGFRAPNIDELAGNNPNVAQMGMDLPSLNLRPENSINYEVGVKTNSDRLRTQTFVFWTDLDDNIVPVPAAMNNNFSRANQDSYIQGVEFNGELMLEGNWALYGNCWYIYGVNEVEGTHLSRIPPMQGILGLRWRDNCSPAYFDVYTWLVDRADRLDPVRDLGDERIPFGGTPGYGTLNMRMGRAFGEYDQHRLSWSLENITDKNYLVHGSGVFGTGFTSRFGYSFVY